MNKEQLIAFEEEIASLFTLGKIKAPIHLYQGNEENIIKIFKKSTQNIWWYQVLVVYLHIINSQKPLYMSWYEDFKTGTKDYLTKGNSKQSKTTSYSKYGSSSWWMSDWDDTSYSNSFTTNTQTKSKNPMCRRSGRRRGTYSTF